MANKAELIKLLKVIFWEAFPEFRGYHFPIRAKVVKVNEAGGKVEEFNKRYSVDVQPLKPDSTIDDSAPVIPDVEIPVIWAGPGRGIFCLPVAGAVVRIGFYYNDPAYPFVDAILDDGFDIPSHALGSFIVQHSDGKRFEITPNGQVKITMDTEITGDVVINGNLSVSENTSIDGSVNVSGGVTAGGSIIDGGGNTNHHSHP